MPKILFYAELYPFRDSYTQHSSVATKYLRMARYVRSFGGTAYVLTNNETADRLVAEDPSAAFYILRVAKREEDLIRSHFIPWGQRAIESWVSFATETSRVSEIYRKILARISKEFEFDLIVCWGDNQAVNDFGASKGVDVLHFELGPTRDPFPETFYFDPVGTNSRASFRSSLLSSSREQPDTDFWLATAAAGHASETKPGPYDHGFMARHRPRCLPAEDGRKICYIPLQLADDLNTQIGSTYASPTEFLEDVLPRLIASNFAPVIKPHPHAHTRPYNLHEECRALELATKYKGLVILDHSDCDAGTWLICNADLVLTINSSVGFEASLFGTKVLLAGQAAYDCTRFPRFDEREVTEQLATYDSDAQKAAVEVMLGEILYPSRLLTSRRFARALLDATSGLKGIDAAERLRRQLGSPITYAFDCDRDSEATGLGVLPNSVEGFLKRKVGRGRNELLIGDLQVTIDSTSVRVGIEEAQASDVEDMADVKVRGWAYGPVTKAPPLAVLLISGDAVIAAATCSEIRDHLQRKNLASCVAGFSMKARMPKLEVAPYLLFISSDLRGSVTPLKIGKYEAGNYVHHELLS